MLKRAAVLLVFLLVASSLPVHAQATPVKVLEDGNNDVQIEVGGTPQSDSSGAYNYLDLQGATIIEDQAGFTFTLEMETLEGPVGGHGALLPQYSLYFRHGDTDFRVIHFGSCFGACLSDEIGSRLLMKAADSDDWSTIAQGSSGGDVVVEGSSITWWLARDLFADQKGAAPFPGRELNRIWAESELRSNSFDIPFPGIPQTGFPLQASDRMPDDGVSAITVPIQFGLTQSGDIILRSEEPFRASNGEATTFLYTVNATNLGSMDHVVQLRAVGLPARWDVSFPVPTAILKPGEPLSVPVLVSTPFAHQHGGAESFIVEMFAPQMAANVGRVELGIRYLEIPQPAGHHDTVFFHSAPWEGDNPFEEVFLTAFAAGAGSSWMNAEELDELDASQPVKASSNTFISVDGGTGSAFHWLIPLSPALRLGMDGDMDGLGTLSFEVSTPVILPAATLSAELAVVGPDDRPGRNQQPNTPYVYPYGFRDVVPIASMAWDAVEIPNNGQATFDIEFPLLPAADFIRYDPAQNLVLAIMLKADRPDVGFAAQDTPALEPGGKMRLPLFEYQDPVDEAFAVASGPVLELRGQPSRLANAGDIMVFEVDIRDQGNAAGDYDLEITGHSESWASIASSKRISLSGGSERASVAIQVPEDALEGEKADLFLQAIHRSDSARRGLVRMVVEVDESRDHMDDRILADELFGPAENTPGLSILVLLAAVAMAAAHRRPAHKF